MSAQQSPVPFVASEVDQHTYQHPWKEERCHMLTESAKDLRANNQDLRLVLRYLERDAARLADDLDLEKIKNSDLHAKVQASTQEADQLQRRIDELEELMDLREDNFNFTVSLPSLSLEVIQSWMDILIHSKKARGRVRGRVRVLESRRLAFFRKIKPAVFLTAVGCTYSL